MKYKILFWIIVLSNLVTAGNYQYETHLENHYTPDGYAAWSNLANAYDNNWGTYAVRSAAGIALIVVNFTVPGEGLVTNATFNVRIESTGGGTNIQILCRNWSNSSSAYSGYANTWRYLAGTSRSNVLESRNDTLLRECFNSSTRVIEVGLLKTGNSDEGRYFESTLEYNLTTTIDNCTNNSGVAINFTVYDEDDTTKKLISDFEVETFINESDLNRSFAFSNRSSFKLCISNNQTVNLDYLYLTNNVASGFTHRYYLIDELLTNETKYINVYNYNTTTGISNLKITARDRATYNFFPNAYTSLQRKYLGEGVWRTVQMDRSGDFGTIFFNIHEENTDYRLIFQDDNNSILKTTDSLKFVCDSGVCDLTVLLDPYSAVGIVENVSVVSSYSNATRVIHINWTSLDLSDVTVHTLVTKDTITGEVIVCESQQTGAAGSLACNASNTTGFVSLKVRSVNGADETPLHAKFIDTTIQKIAQIIGNREGAIWSFAIVLTMVMFGVFSPVGAVMAMVVGIMIVYYLGLLTLFNVAILIIGGILALVVAIKVRS